MSDDTPAAAALRTALAKALPCAAAATAPQLWQPTRLADVELEQAALARQALCEALWQAVAGAVNDAQAEARHRGSTALLVTSCQRAAALLHELCGLGQNGPFAVEPQPHGLSCADVALANAGQPIRVTLHCINTRMHLLAPVEAPTGPANASDA